MIRHHLWACAVAISSLVASAAAGPIVPTGLTPGDKYYLAFVTRDGRNATSTNIADYNSFAQAQAALNPSLTGTDVGVTWKALGSTASVSALTNLGLGEFPIYLLDGTTKIADGATDLWDGSLDNALDLTQFLVSPFASVFTGTNANGTAAGTGGSWALGTTTVTNVFGDNDLWVSVGLSFQTNSNWLNSSGISQPNGNRPFYAFSQQLTAPVPEPGTLALGTLGAIGLLLVARRRIGVSTQVSG
jgi:hypothetical protein